MRGRAILSGALLVGLAAEPSLSLCPRPSVKDGPVLDWMDEQQWDRSLSADSPVRAMAQRLKKDRIGWDEVLVSSPEQGKSGVRFYWLRLLQGHAGTYHFLSRLVAVCGAQPCGQLNFDQGGNIVGTPRPQEFPDRIQISGQGRQFQLFAYPERGPWMHKLKAEDRRYFSAVDRYSFSVGSGFQFVCSRSIEQDSAIAR